MPHSLANPSPPTLRPSQTRHPELEAPGHGACPPSFFPAPLRIARPSPLLFRERPRSPRWGGRMARPGPSVPPLRGQRAHREATGRAEAPKAQRPKGRAGLPRRCVLDHQFGCSPPCHSPRSGSRQSEQGRGPVGNKASDRKGRAEGQRDVDRQSESEDLGVERELKREPILKDRRNYKGNAGWRGLLRGSGAPSSSVRQF